MLINTQLGKKDIQAIIQNLKKSDNVCVLADKNNPTPRILVADHKLWVTDHLLKKADLDLHPKVIGILKKQTS